MASDQIDEIDWGCTGKSLERLLKYERATGQYEHASHELLEAIVHGSVNSTWRRFLLEGDNLAAVVEQVISISDGDVTGPKAVLDSICKVVQSAFARRPRTASSFLSVYLKYRPSFPVSVRDGLDRHVRAGRRTIPLRAATLASGLERLGLIVPRDGAGGEVFDYWYQEIARGRIKARQVRKIPAQVVAARDRLLRHLREVENDPHIGEDAVYERYARVFTSRDIPTMADLVIGVRQFNLIRHVQGRFGVEQIEPFLENLGSKEEVMSRFEKLEQWIGKYHRTNHDGTVLTPPLIAFLSRKASFESLLDELDRYREDTRNGRFNQDNIVQRDLEFRRFEYEYTRVLEPLSYELRGRYPAPMSTDDLYRLFNQLEQLPAPTMEEFHLNTRQIAEVGRAAYEAAGFLQFLREFSARTSRHIVVVGNDRFGRQWFVEPIQKHLGDGFTVRYERVRSGTSMRLSVPSPFPRQFVREINEHMPHIVIVDGCHAPGDPNVMALSRALRDYANWFAVFNDIRAEGDAIKYQHQSSLPADHFPELKKWHEYARERQWLRELVSPGPTYKVTTWAPELKDRVRLGDIRVSRQPQKIAGEQPLVVLANPIVYRTEGDDLTSVLRGTTPRYFDDPDEHFRSSVVFGFGSHGLETRLIGTSTEIFVSTVQRHIEAEVDRLLQKSSLPAVAL